MEKPFSAWRPSLPAYLQFLSDHHVMHEALEKGTHLSDQRELPWAPILQVSNTFSLVIVDLRACSPLVWLS
jgi:hypothetical protein